MKNRVSTIAVSIFIVYLLGGCSSSENKKLDVMDCILTVESQYDIETNDKNSLISLTPNTLPHQFFFINYYGAESKSRYMKDCMKKKESSMIINNHLQICVAPTKVDDIESNIYTVFGNNFYMYFGNMNDNAKKLLKSCNDTWRR